MRSCLIVLLICFLTPALSVAGDVLMFGGGIEVEEVDLDALLSGGPDKAKSDVISSQKQLHQLLRQIYLIRALSIEATEQGLGDSELFKARLRRQREKMLYLERLKQLDAEPLPEFEQAAKEQYLGNPEAYTIPERVDARHILISTTDRLPKYHSKDEALEIVKKVKSEIDGGRSFEDLATAYSEDPVTSKNRGSLGLFKRGVMVEPFDKAVFALHKPGQISDIVESPFGYHIIKLEGHYPAQKLEYKHVKDKIVEKLKSDFIQKRRDTYFDALLKKNKASIYEDLVEKYAEERLKPASK
ncbi:MAG: peptidylprolyl isomerase [Candidatus Thiodiazotropha sp. (ex Codakia rugifera)]|nr:peptidylprolyl isomerase [Candidatus Thiodiazotropha sp. (ex Codakia rugifera)]